MNLIELDRALRQLRLCGMANVLKTRLRQAQAQPLTPILRCPPLAGVHTSPEEQNSQGLTALGGSAIGVCMAK